MAADYTDPQTQADASAMNNALIAHGYKITDQGLYRAFQTDAGLTADGFPGTNTMNELHAVLFANGITMADVPIYPWLSSGRYDGVNAPTASQWGISGGGGGTTPVVVVPGGSTSTTTTTSTASMFSTATPWLVGAAVLAGVALIYESAKHPIGSHARKASRGMHGHARRLLHRGRRRR
jgi:hypothetical protein